MNKYLFTYSESLVLSLSKEIEYIKSRSKNINYSLKTCQNKILSKRLISELNKLNQNRLKIISITENTLKKNINELSLEFLLELTKRSNSFQQI
tara:strand:- start:3808 stop:4089 length:282 start_codon:yes stop_codon:yes gene_type:complete